MTNKNVSRQGFWVAATAFLSLVYSLVVRDLRTEHKAAATGVLISIAQPLIFGLVFFFMIDLFSVRNSMVRGDDLTFVMSGFVLFFFHQRTASAVTGAIKKNMMNHSRATPFLFVVVKAISAGYTNLLALLVLLALNYLLRGVYEMDNALAFAMVLFWCWLSGVAVGMIFMGLKEYFSWASVAQTAYSRVMFFTSGKFFVANQIGPTLRPLFEWNPLYHLVDQSRDAIFLNYTAKFTSLGYPALITMSLLAIGFLAEHYVRQNYNASRFPK